MNNEEIMNKLECIIREVLDDNSIVLNSDTKIDDILGMTSLKQFTLIEAIEQEFSIEFQLVEVVKVTVVKDLLEMIQKKISFVG